MEIKNIFYASVLIILPFGAATAQTDTSCEAAQADLEQCLTYASVTQTSCNVGGSLGIGIALHYLFEDDLVSDLVGVGAGVMLGEGCSNIYEDEVTQCTNAIQPAIDARCAEEQPPADDANTDGEEDEENEDGDTQIDTGDVGDIDDFLDDYFGDEEMPWDDCSECTIEDIVEQ